MLLLSIAGITVGVDNRYKHIERISRDYTVDCGEALFTVSASDEDIARERASLDTDFHDAVIESTVIHRKIAEQLWRYDAFLFHGAVLSVDGEAYAFTAPSGTGKTTHTRLWLDLMGARAQYLNGDKPIIRFIDGVPYAYGTPWLGKEGYGSNISAPLVGIARLARGKENSARTVSFDDLSSALISQIYIPRAPLAAARTLALIGRLSEGVKLVELQCNMEKDAAATAAAAFGIKL